MGLAANIPRLRVSLAIVALHNRNLGRAPNKFLPDPVIAAVAHHHPPLRMTQSHFDVLGALAICCGFSAVCECNMVSEATLRVVPDTMGNLRLAVLDGGPRSR